MRVDAARVPRLARLIPYLLLGLVLVVLMASQTNNRRWSSDYWVHQATIEHVERDPDEGVSPSQ